MKKIVAVERFDPKKLTYIVNNWESLPLNRPGDKTKALIALKKYLGKSSNGKATIPYSQKDGIGRHRTAIGQQNIIREVRHTIAGHLYVDIDIVNSAPTILEQYCRKNGISCPMLTQYVNERGALLQELETSCGLSRDDAKEGIITIINGGRGFADMDLPEWVLRFKHEMEGFRDRVFTTETIYATLGKKKAAEKKKDGEWSNPKGSAVCMLYHDIEDKILMAMLEYLINENIIKANKGEYVLVYDGIQILRELLENRELSDIMEGMMTHALEKTGYAIQLKSKAMDQVIPLPDDLTVEEKPAIIITDQENEASLIFLREVADDIRKCDGIEYVRKNGIWTSNSKLVEGYLLDRCLDMNFVKLNEKGEQVAYSSKVAGAANIIKAARARVPDDPTFVKRLSDSNRGKMVFMDGYYDFEKGEFISGFEGVESTIQISRPFPERDEALIAEVDERIIKCVLGDKRVSFLQFLARAFAGCTDDKVWGVFLGERNSGKGVVGALIESAIGQYITTISPDSLLCQRLSFGGDEPKRFSWTTCMEFTRLTLTNEIKLDQENNVKIDGNAVKRISGGSSDKIKVRACYQEARDMTIQSTLLMACNDLPEIAPKDATETLVAFRCPYKFVKKDDEMLNQYPHIKLADQKIKAFASREDVGNAFFHLVADHFRDEPMTLIQEMKDFRDDFKDDDEMKLIDEAFHVTDNENNVVLTSVVQSFLKDNKINMTVPKFALVVLNRGAKTHRVKVNNKVVRAYKKLVYIPPQKKEEEKPITMK